MTLSGNKSNLGNYSLIASKDESTTNANLKNIQNFDVEIVTLDSFLQSLKNLQFIKLDVEGFEYQVLIGATKCLHKFHLVIAIEQLPRDFIDGKSDSIEFLTSLGYRFYWQRNFSQSKSKIIEKLSQLIQYLVGFQFEYIESSDCVPPGHYSMLIAIHESKITGILSNKNE